jgi:hypothetical protein
VPSDSTPDPNSGPYVFKHDPKLGKLGGCDLTKLGLLGSKPKVFDGFRQPLPDALGLLMDLMDLLARNLPRRLPAAAALVLQQALHAVEGFSNERD